MRIHLKIQPTCRVIPFNHQHLLVGTIHKWLGWNKEHGQISLFSFSRMDHAKATVEGLKFENGSSLFISAHDPNVIKKLVTGIKANPTMFHDLVVREIIVQENPDFSDRELFLVGSPVFIKRREGQNIEHILYNDARSSKYLIETLKTKMKVVGLDDETIDITFKTDYPNVTTKKINYNGIENRTSWCPVVIKGKSETKLFAWNVGIGNSTGIGFGSII